MDCTGSCSGARKSNTAYLLKCLFIYTVLFLLFSFSQVFCMPTASSCCIRDEYFFAQRQTQHLFTCSNYSLIYLKLCSFLIDRACCLCIIH
ncbi:hypothetical protein AC915_22405 [Salmonella enterica]|nr:hypothetical protein [Salmonella enterica]EBP2212668.1 hypothetical protein [Salmonella enterica]EBP7109908.1 hypothetical protein [Salmonella enterica]